MPLAGQSDLVELFRQQASILETHANILAQQTAILSGEKVAENLGELETS